MRKDFRMRVPRLSVAFFALLLAPAACNEKNDPANAVSGEETYLAGQATNTAGSPEVGGTTLSSDINPVGGVLDPQTFANTVAGSDLFEIESGKLAEARASSPQLKAFAAQLVADHSRSSAMLKSAAGGANPPLTMPTALPPDLQSALGSLQMAKPQDFDAGFIDTQIQGHKKALEVLTQYAKEGGSPALREFALKAIPVVQSHLAKLNGMNPNPPEPL
jgi:putative membrane protein